jgi:hypothetical protein
MALGADDRTQLIAIREQRGSEKTFGASGKFGHHFELTPQSANAIRQFEKELGVELPSEYSQFLMECGCGAGPYYGLFCPSKILGEIRALNWNLPPNNKPGSPNLDFPFSKADAQAVLVRMENHHPEPYLRAAWLSDGYGGILLHSIDKLVYPIFLQRYSQGLDLSLAPLTLCSMAVEGGEPCLTTNGGPGPYSSNTGRCLTYLLILAIQLFSRFMSVTPSRSTPPNGVLALGQEG